MTPQALIAPARLAGVPLLRAQSDERLVDLFRAGNEAAFEAIVSRYRRPLLRYCSGFLSEPRAEDVVQQAFVRAYGALRESDGEMNLRPWLYRIGHNTALNALRDRAIQHEELSEDVDGVERPDQAFERSERLRDVVAAVGALPDRQREAIVLRELEGRSYEEIAAELGVSDGSVRQLLNRARNSLRSGVSAVTPFGLLARVPLDAAGETTTVRVAEMVGGGAGAAVLTKVCATALVTGAVVGGVAGSPDGGLGDGRAQLPDPSPRGTAGPAAPDRSDDARSSSPRDGLEGDDRGRARGRGGDDRRERDEDREEDGERPDDRDGDEDRSGPGGGGDDDDDRSGPGGGGDDDSDNSGPGGGGDHDLADDDNSGSGSGSSGSGSSGTSGSGSSGSGGSGSGSSGSGSSGSGSGDDDDPDGL